MLSDADAALAERRKLVKITGDATRKEFDAQQAGFPSTGRVREFGEKAAEEGSKIEEESSAGLGGGAAVTTANLRAFPAGKGPGAAPSGGDHLGRASCRERVCQSVSMSVVAGSLTQTYKNTHVSII